MRARTSVAALVVVICGGVACSAPQGSDSADAPQVQTSVVGEPMSTPPLPNSVAQVPNSVTEVPTSESAAVTDDPALLLTLGDQIWTMNQGVLTPTRQLEITPWSRYGGGTFQSVVPLGDGRLLVMGSRSVEPLPEFSDLYVVDAEGASTLLIERVTSFALSATGWLATVEADTSASRGTVRVRETLDGPGLDWSDGQDSFVLEGWADDSLVAIRSQGDSGPPSLLIFDGPQKERVLAAAGNMNAISPDGSTLLVSRLDGDQTVNAIVRLADLSEVSVPVADDVTLGVTSWIGDSIIASFISPTAQGFLVFRMADGTLTLERTVNVPFEVTPVLNDAFVLRDGTIGGYGANADYRPSPAIGDHSEAPSVVVLCRPGREVCVAQLVSGEGQLNRVRNPSRGSGPLNLVEPEA